MTITHPHHPLYGKQVALVRVRQGKDPDLIIRLPDETHAAVAASLTDYGGLSNPPAPTVTISSLLNLEGLRRAAQFIAHIRQTTPEA